MSDQLINPHSNHIWDQSFAEQSHPITSLLYIGIKKVPLQRRGDLDQRLLKREAF